MRGGLFWSRPLVRIVTAAAAATAYFSTTNNLPAPFPRTSDARRWPPLAPRGAAARGPVRAWCGASRVYTITTRRAYRATRRALLLSRSEAKCRARPRVPDLGAPRAAAADVVRAHADADNGVDATLVLVNACRTGTLVHEALVDQVEVSQISPSPRRRPGHAGTRRMPRRRFPRG